MKDWLQQVPIEDQAQNSRIGVAPLSGTARPALIVVDFTMGFCGSEGVCLEEVAKEFPKACGAAAWNAIPKTARLLDTFRLLKLPIVYTFIDWTSSASRGRSQSSSSAVTTGLHLALTRSRTRSRRGRVSGSWANRKRALSSRRRWLSISRGWVLIQPLSVVDQRPDVFAQRQLMLLSYGLHTMVVDDCCFDRSYYAHWASLFDLHSKYASVLSVEELADMINRGAQPTSPVSA
jgi:nicotinamidase-related amidase